MGGRKYSVILPSEALAYMLPITAKRGARRFSEVQAQFWATLVLQSLPCREAYIMYVACIMYKKA